MQQLLKLPKPHRLNHPSFSTSKPPPPHQPPHPPTQTTHTHTATTISNLVLTTTNPTHLTKTLLKIPFTTTLINQTLKHLWNHGPKALQFFTILDTHNHPTYTHSLSSFHHALDIAARISAHSAVTSLLFRLHSLRLGPTPLTLSILIERHVSAGKPDKAINLFLSSHHRFNLPQSLSSFNDLLDVLCKSKRVEKAQSLLRAFRPKFGADVISYNIIANGWCLVKRVNQGLKVLKEMVENGINPNLSSYNIILKGYFRAGMVKEGWEFFKEMKRRKIEVDVITYSTLIHGFGVAGEVSKARKLFEEMVSDGVLPNVATYNGLIQVLCKKDCVESAVEVFEEMVRKGYVPDKVTYNLLIRGFCHRGEMERAEGFVDLMRKDGCEPNVQTFNMLIRYYCEVGEIEKGLEVFERMGKEGVCLPDMDTYNVLISSMFVRKKSEDLVVAGRLLVEMVDRRFVPTKLMFNRVVDGLLVTGNQGYAREILRLQSKCGVLPKRFRL